MKVTAVPLVNVFEKLQTNGFGKIGVITHVWPVEAVTVYLAIGAPPVVAGAVKRTAALAFDAVAETPVTMLGLPAGVTAADAADAVDVPAEFVAVVENLYEVPSSKPEITQVVAGAKTLQLFSGLSGTPALFNAVTTYESAGPPPLPGLTVIVALPLPARAVGADGTAGGSNVHCAIKVTLFVVVFVYVAAGVVTPPPIQPASE